MTPLSPDVIRAALTAVTGLVPRHPVMRPAPTPEALDHEEFVARLLDDPRADEPLPDHDPLDDAEGT